MFAPPLHLPFLLRLDPSGQSAVLISVAQIGKRTIGFAASRFNAA
jgi:hypothetical protein